MPSICSLCYRPVPPIPPSPGPLPAQLDAKGVIAQQDLFSVYVHTMPGFYYREGVRAWRLHAWLPSVHRGYQLSTLIATQVHPCGVMDAWTVFLLVVCNFCQSLNALVVQTRFFLDTKSTSVCL